MEAQARRRSPEEVEEAGGTQGGRERAVEEAEAEAEAEAAMAKRGMASTTRTAEARRGSARTHNTTSRVHLRGRTTARPEEARRRAEKEAAAEVVEATSLAGKRAEEEAKVVEEVRRAVEAEAEDNTSRIREATSIRLPIRWRTSSWPKARKAVAVEEVEAEEVARKRSRSRLTTSPRRVARRVHRRRTRAEEALAEGVEAAAIRPCPREPRKTTILPPRRREGEEGIRRRIRRAEATRKEAAPERASITMKAPRRSHSSSNKARARASSTNSNTERKRVVARAEEVNINTRTIGKKRETVTKIPVSRMASPAQQSPAIKRRARVIRVSSSNSGSNKTRTNSTKGSREIEEKTTFPPDFVARSSSSSNSTLRTNMPTRLTEEVGESIAEEAEAEAVEVAEAEVADVIRGEILPTTISNSTRGTSTSRGLARGGTLPLLWEIGRELLLPEPVLLHRAHLERRTTEGTTTSSRSSNSSTTANPTMIKIVPSTSRRLPNTGFKTNNVITRRDNRLAALASAPRARTTIARPKTQGGARARGIAAAAPTAAAEAAGEVGGQEETGAAGTSERTVPPRHREILAGTTEPRAEGA